MYLRTLELHGFKSFAEATDLQFAPGVTAIVGPNGCGKSNVVDAVRWVIGEQRPTALRSEKMENVIFNGTADRRAVGMAEVELTIENNRGVLPTEYNEVTIGRRLFRDGTSEYLMNGTQCRLKDITDLFMDTGMGADAYSVIELKMIDEILSDSAQDRRRLFEEAAGITKYKLRRRQSLRKLDNTQADLTRLRDLTDEIGKKVRRLKRQAETAAKYKEFAATLRTQELALAQVEYERLTAQRADLEDGVGDAQRQVEAETERQEAAEDKIQLLRRRLDDEEQTLAQRRAELAEHREQVRGLEGEQRLQHERLETARRDRQRLLREQDEAAARRTDLEQMQQRLSEDLEQALPARDEANAALEEAEAARDEARDAAEDQRRALRALRDEAEAADEERAAQYRALDRLTSRLELLEDEQARAETQRAELEENAEALSARVRQAEADLEQAQAAAEEARQQLADAEAKHTQRQETLEDATETLRRLERQRDAAAAEVDLLSGLVASYDEFSGAVQFLADAEWAAGDLLTVADVLACDDADRLALDAALGDLASCVVAEDRAAARAAVDLLRREEKGQATFILLNDLPDAPATDAFPDPAQPLRAAVRVAEPKYAPLADVLLFGRGLAETLDDAQTAAAADAQGRRVYARTGEWAGGRGFVRGGSRPQAASPVASRLGRREQLDAARNTLERLENEAEQQQKAVAEAKEAVAAVPLEERRAARAEAADALADAEKKAERVRYEQDTLGERLSDLQSRLATLDDDIAADRAEVESLETTLADADDEQQALRDKLDDAEDAFRAAEAESRAAQERQSAAHVRAVEARNRAENLQRDMDRTRQRLADLEAQAEQRARDLKELAATIETAQDEQADLQREIDALRDGRSDREDAAVEAQEAVAATKAAIAETEDTLRTLRQTREEHMRQENQRAVRLAEVKTRLEDLVRSIEEDFEITLDDAPDPPEDFDEEAARSEVTDLRKKIKRLGSVNPLALEEYEEEKERHDFLTEQQADLEQAEETLLETIDEINETAAARFHETFEAIQTSFSDLFERLFGAGAQARLELDADEDDPLEATIEIIAQPKGKKPSVLSQLSSGEKTLTAIALLFAIYLVKPSPFCILDEVDAPLDEANVERFMNLIRDFAGDTQFILVTHNKRTMALADRMYGITMQERGVSKLVGVAFDEAQEMAAAA